MISKFLERNTHGMGRNPGMGKYVIPKIKNIKMKKKNIIVVLSDYKVSWEILFGRNAYCLK